MNEPRTFRKIFFERRSDSFMSRRDILVSCAALLVAPLVTPRVTKAQQPAKVYRIGMLGTLESGPNNALLWAALRDLGWIEGKNFTAERRFAEGKLERYPDLAAELVRLNVDVLVAIATPATAAAKKATATVPIVFIDVGDPVASGFVASFSRPGGNATGVSSVNTELSQKRLELLRAAFPKLTRVAVVACCFGTPALDGILRTFLDDSTAAARAMDITAQPLALKNLDNPSALFATIRKDRGDALIVLPGPWGVARRTELAELALRHRLPTMFDDPSNAAAGALMSYGVDRAEMYRRAAAFVDRVLKGTKPAEIPVEQPTKLKLVINLKTAKALGLTIPPVLLLRADQVIE
jgi:putative ABC transport system substrate-binding protein